MKSEHRHELKTNDLAKSIITFQDYVRVYGGRVALGVAIVVLIVVLIMQRMNRSTAQAVKVQEDLAYARNQVDQLGHLRPDGQGRLAVKPGDMGQIRKILQEIRDDASDKRLQAEATLALGDLAWTLANFPELPGATTEPSMRPERDRSELLKDAKDSYQQVVDKYGDQMLAVAAARFGLGAVAENLSNWDEAKRHYEAIKGMGEGADSFKRLAEVKLAALDQLKQPLLVGQVPEKAEPAPVPPGQDDTYTFPSTAPTTGPTATASPTTRPAAPANGPTTKPAK